MDELVPVEPNPATDDFVVFVPRERLVTADAEALRRWRDGLDRLLLVGWKVAQTYDLIRDGYVLRGHLARPRITQHRSQERA